MMSQSDEDYDNRPNTQMVQCPHCHYHMDASAYTDAEDTEDGGVVFGYVCWTCEYEFDIEE